MNESQDMSARTQVLFWNWNNINHIQDDDDDDDDNDAAAAVVFITFMQGVYNLCYM